jgi:hypothetical protein
MTKAQAEAIANAIGAKVRELLQPMDAQIEALRAENEQLREDLANVVTAVRQLQDERAL